MKRSGIPTTAKRKRGIQVDARPEEAARKSQDGAQKRRRPYLPADERRRRIIAAAQEVFARTSLQGARTRDLAKAAAINQATLFEHFESKEALFHEAVVKPLLEAMHGMRDRAVAYQGAKSFEEFQRLARNSVERQVELMGKIFPLFTAALFSDLAAGRKLYREQIVPILKQRGDAVSDLIRHELDPQFAELATFGILLALAMDQTFRGKVWNIPDIVDQIMIITTTGCAKQPGASTQRKKSRNAKTT